MVERRMVSKANLHKIKSIFTVLLCKKDEMFMTSYLSDGAVIVPAAQPVVIVPKLNSWSQLSLVNHSATINTESYLKDNTRGY